LRLLLLGRGLPLALVFAVGFAFGFGFSLVAFDKPAGLTSDAFAPGAATGAEVSFGALFVLSVAAGVATFFLPKSPSLFSQLLSLSSDIF